MEKLRKIFLIDDDDISNFITTNTLNELNIADEVQVFNDGLKCYENIIESYKNQSTFPELVIFDNQMPVMNGSELINTLHQEVPNIFREVVFVFLRTNATKKSVDNYLKLGIKEVINKPITEEAVMDIYNKYWGKEVGA